MISKFKLAFISTAFLSLSACVGGNDSSPAPEQATPATSAYLLSSGNILLPIDFEKANVSRTPIPVLNLNNENLVDIDYRPADGQMYGLTDANKIYQINPATGSATLVSTLTGFSGTVTENFSIDFNPTIDRLRVVSTSGDNLAVDVNTGAVTVQGTINGGMNPSVDSVAYTDSFGSAGRITTLFTLDSANDVLSIQAPAAGGNQTSQVSLGVESTAVKGFDISASNQAYAVLTVNGQNGLYSIDIATNSPQAARLISALPTGANYDVGALAIPVPANPTVVALLDGNQISTFRKSDPSQVSNPVAITGMTGNAIAADYSPSENGLVVLSSSGELFKVTLAGAATPIITVAEPLVSGVTYSMDFNPTGTPNALRVVGSNGSNWAVNISTGVTAVQGTINPAGVLVSDHAYLNSVRKPGNVGPSMTRLFALDVSNQELSTQRVAAGMPNDGEITRVAPFGLTVTSTSGFDIGGLNNENVLMAGVTDSQGTPQLYSVNLNAASSESALQLIGEIGSSTAPLNLIDIAIQY